MISKLVIKLSKENFTLLTLLMFLNQGNIMILRRISVVKAFYFFSTHKQNNELILINYFFSAP